MTDRSSANIWGCDWKEKVASRLRSSGCITVAEFLARHPGRPYTEVAAELGGDVAALQIEWMQWEEARRDDTIRIVAMDSLARDLRKSLRNGWEGGAAGNFDTARAFGVWSARLGPEFANLANVLWDTLEALKPPCGWMPSGPDDGFIVEAFRRAWPEE